MPHGWVLMVRYGELLGHHLGKWWFYPDNEGVLQPRFHEESFTAKMMGLGK